MEDYLAARGEKEDEKEEEEVPSAGEEGEAMGMMWDASLNCPK